MSTLDPASEIAPPLPDPNQDLGRTGTLPEGPRLLSCFHLLESVESQLRFGDSKAAFLATINALLIAPMVYNVPILRLALRQWDPISRAILIGLVGTYGLLFLSSIWMVALAVLPRFRRPPSERPPSRLFFGRIARDFGADPDRFVAQLAAMTEHDWLNELGNDVVAVSRIAAAKHRHVRRATVLTVASVVAWCALLVATLGLK